MRREQPLPPGPPGSSRTEDRTWSYTQVGATADPVMPPGFRHLHRSVVLGTGFDVFDCAASALMSWSMHRRAGLAVAPEAPVTAGATVVLTYRLGPVSLPAPVRVVAVFDTPGRRGFSYGTLEGHPESGEESFSVNLATSGQVTFEIVAFSRHTTWWARLGGPVTRTVQTRITDRYIRSIRHSVRDRPV